jgi:hypothetical protein
MDFSLLGPELSKPRVKSVRVKREPMPPPKLTGAGAAADFPMDVDEYAFQDRMEMGYVEPPSPLPGPSSCIPGGGARMPILPETDDALSLPLPDDTVEDEHDSRGFDSEGDATNDDYESTQAQRMRQVMHDRQTHPWDHIMLTDKEDKDDKEEFEKEVAEKEVCCKKRKGKQKAPGPISKGQTKQGKAVTQIVDNSTDNADGQDAPKKWQRQEPWIRHPTDSCSSTRLNLTTRWRPSR